MRFYLELNPAHLLGHPLYKECESAKLTHQTESTRTDSIPKKTKKIT